MWVPKTMQNLHYAKPSQQVSVFHGGVSNGFSSLEKWGHLGIKNEDRIFLGKNGESA